MIAHSGIFHLECHYNLKKNVSKYPGKTTLFLQTIAHYILENVVGSLFHEGFLNHSCISENKSKRYRNILPRTQFLSHYSFVQNFWTCAHILLAPLLANLFPFLFTLCPTLTVFLSHQATFQPLPTWNSEATSFCSLIQSRFLAFSRLQ